jgi:hypothetical protein
LDRVRAPKGFGDFLEVRLGQAEGSADAFAKIPLKATDGRKESDGSITYTVSMQALNADNESFDRIVLHATKQVPDTFVEVQSIKLIAPAPGELLPQAQKKVLPRKKVRLAIDCRAPKKTISPLIYGIAFTPRRVGQETALWDLKSPIRRWGGNPASRYNWKLGNAWNTASDWFFKNTNYTGVEHYSWKDFLADNAEHHTQAAMTLPMIGWVAKDTDSYSFSVAKMGAQKYASGDAGNGLNAQGKKLASPSPSTTSEPASPAYVAQWVTEMEAWQKQGHPHTVAQYILDNEPALWNSTHRDIHPDALTYDELLAKTLAYGTAVRHAAPEAEIAGPAEWGWPAYFYSAKDAEVGFRLKPDRRAHGDVPLINWYLTELHHHAQKTGTTVLDTLDLHYYPQTSGVYGHGEQTGAEGARKRLRATRSLWDPSHQDESWIADKIALLPRMQSLIDSTYPGRKISLGEYSFGGMKHISGGLAQAEALGRFGQGQVHSAYLWTYPDAGTPQAEAFAAFRNYDGAGAQFPDQGLQTSMAQNVSLFAAQGAQDHRLVAIALNLNDDFDADADIELVGCGAYTGVRTFTFDAETPKLHPASAGGRTVGTTVHQSLPSYSLMVIELTP